MRTLQRVSACACDSAVIIDVEGEAGRGFFIFFFFSSTRAVIDLSAHTRARAADEPSLIDRCRYVLLLLCGIVTIGRRTIAINVPTKKSPRTSSRNNCMCIYTNSKN